MKIKMVAGLSFNWVSRDGKLIILSRGLCTFAQSFIAIILAIYLDKLGFNLIQIGAFLSAGLAGSAFFAFIISLASEKLGRRRLLVVLTLFSAFSGLSMIFIDSFLPLIFIAFIGSIIGRNQLGPVQSLEQASLSEVAPSKKRTDIFAIYRIVFMGGAALGALAAGLPAILQDAFYLSDISAYRVMFGGFAVFHLAAAILYSSLSLKVETASNEQHWVNPLRLRSRRIIFTLTGLFSLDHLAGSLVLQSLVAYWFYTKFGLQLESLAQVFFLSYMLAAVSIWLSAKLANRIGLINTMVFTHIPASLFLIATAFAPNVIMAVIFWQLRSLLGMMDIPARDSYTMSVVQPNERVAMASLNIAGRSVSGTVGPALATVLWQTFMASMPFIVCGGLKIIYDMSLYYLFRNLKPPQELDDT